MKVAGKLGIGWLLLIGVLVCSCAQTTRPDGALVISEKKVWVKSGDLVAISETTSSILTVKVLEDAVEFENAKVVLSIKRSGFDYPTGLAVWQIDSEENKALINRANLYGPN